MRILFVATEAVPVAKVGGMGDVVGALPKVLREMGHDVRIFMPYYGFMADKMKVPKEPIWTGTAMLQDVEVYESTLPGTDVPLYLFGHPAFAPRRVYYGEDEDWRFTLFANGATEFAWKYDWRPEILHCHDWHTGMIPVWMHETPDIKTIFTIHNLAYQGPWRWRLEQITWCPWYMQGHNTMAAAVQFADRVTTVSPTYAEQIRTPAYGEQLDGLAVFSSAAKMSGILNGIDRKLYDPATDRHIPQTFTAETLDNRAANKVSLQEELGLEVNSGAFFSRHGVAIGRAKRARSDPANDRSLHCLQRRTVRCIGHGRSLLRNGAVAASLALSGSSLGLPAAQRYIGAPNLYGFRCVPDAIAL